MYVGIRSKRSFTHRCLWVDRLCNTYWAYKTGAIALSTADGESYEEKIRNENKDRFNLVALLKVCAKKKQLYKGTIMHTYVQKRGLLQRSPYVASSLINMFAKCGEFEKAEKILEEIPFSNVVTWNTLITGYVQQGKAYEALTCYDRLLIKGISPSVITYTCVLKACGEVRALDKGKKIHYEILNRGLLDRDVILGSALLGMYAKCGMIGRAQEVHENMNVRNVVSWSALIIGYVQHGQACQALTCFERMSVEGYSADAVTFTGILQACASIGEIHKGKRVHKEIVNSSLLKKDVILGNALVNMYAKCGELDTAEQVLEELHVRNAISWNALIAGYVQQGQGYEALNCFERMQSEGLSPSVTTFICTLEACAITRAIEKGNQIHDLIMNRSLLDDSIALGNALLDFYAKCGQLAKAKLLLEELLIRDTISWNILISGYVQQEQGKEAESCFDKMQNDLVLPNSVTLISVLNACGITRNLRKGKQLHSLILIIGLLENDVVLGNALVDMYCKCWLPAKAREVFEELPTRDRGSWNSLISGYVQMEQGHKALNCFKKMQLEGFCPDSITFICVLKACSSLGMMDAGKLIYSEVSGFSLLKDILLGNSLINTCAKCGWLSKARNLFEELPIRNIVSWNSLIAGYAQQGLGHEALNSFLCMQYEGISPNEVTFKCILNACVRSGLLNEAETLFGCMIRSFGIIPNSLHHNSMMEVYGCSGQLSKAMSIIKIMPCCKYSAIWCILMDACRKWGNMMLGKLAFDQVLKPENNVVCSKFLV